MKSSNRLEASAGVALAVIFASLLSAFTLGVVLPRLQQNRTAGATPSQAEPRTSPPSRPSSAPAPSAELRRAHHARDQSPVPRPSREAEQPVARETPPVHVGTVTTERGVYHAFLTPTVQIVRTLPVGGSAFGWHLYAADATSFSFVKEDHHYVVERR
jgi:hypothetical protein